MYNMAMGDQDLSTRTTTGLPGAAFLQVLLLCQTIFGMPQLQGVLDQCFIHQNKATVGVPTFTLHPCRQYNQFMHFNDCLWHFMAMFISEANPGLPWTISDS